MSSVTYRDRVYGLLINLQGEFSIDEKVSPENRSEFIEIVKEAIRYDMFENLNFIIEFNNDYSKLRKLTRP